MVPGKCRKLAANHQRCYLFKVVLLKAVERACEHETCGLWQSILAEFLEEWRRIEATNSQGIVPYTSYVGCRPICCQRQILQPWKEVVGYLVQEIVPAYGRAIGYSGQVPPEWRRSSWQNW